jgi:hypothetical protein
MSGGTGDWDLLDTDNLEGSAPLPQMPAALCQATSRLAHVK